MRLAIVALKPRGSGEEVELSVSIESGENRELRSLVVSTKMLLELGNVGPNVLPFELSTAQLDSLLANAELWIAVKKGLTLLSYADSSKRRLADKLRERGFERFVAEDAAEYIASLGYIDESRQLSREARALAAKGYGRSRIRAELMRRGFGSDALLELDDALADVDFDEVLRAALLKKVRVERLSDRKYVESLIAAMFRLGHAPAEVRAALRELR